MWKYLLFLVFLAAAVSFRPAPEKRDAAYFTNEIYNYDTETLFQLEAFDEIALADHFAARYAVTAYYTEISCMSCVQRELESMRTMKERLGDRLDFVLVTYNPGFAQNGSAGNYLLDLRRVGRIDWPILLEAEKGAASLGNRFTIALLDKQRGEIIYRYFPDSEREDLWTRFEQTVTQIIDKE
ncbi:MAG: hypothetical protein QNK37_28210 [Acidobacteriota bacterium]|nr:hypothetical protein [Acidobacteriota bacterium]